MPRLNANSRPHSNALNKLLNSSRRLKPPRSNAPSKPLSNSDSSKRPRPRLNNAPSRQLNSSTNSKPLRLRHSNVPNRRLSNGSSKQLKPNSRLPSNSGNNRQPKPQRSSGSSKRLKPNSRRPSNAPGRRLSKPLVHTRRRRSSRSDPTADIPASRSVTDRVEGLERFRATWTTVRSRQTRSVCAEKTR
jgi:hypothetical protein